MQFPDLWSLLTGIASIISLFLSAGERFASWRKYTVSGAAAFGGFAIGRISTALSSGIDQISANPIAIGFVIVFFLIVSAITYIAYLFLIKGEAFFAYFIFFMGLTSVPEGIMPMYTRAFDSIPVGDYIKLAQVKASDDEFEQAINYLEIARDRSTNDQLKKQLKEQIVLLQNQDTKIQINQNEN